MMHLRNLFTQRRARHDLGAYVRGELPAERRRAVITALDRDDGLYADYRRLRDDTHEVDSRLASVGRIERTTLDRAWAGISSSLGANSLYRLSSAPRLSWRQRITAVILAIIVLIPAAYGIRPVSGLEIPTQPLPRALLENITPIGDEIDRVVTTPWRPYHEVIAQATPPAP